MPEGLPPHMVPLCGWICGSWCTREPPLRPPPRSLGCGAVSGPQQERCHAVDDVEDMLTDVREVALSRLYDCTVLYRNQNCHCIASASRRSECWLTGQSKHYGRDPEQERVCRRNRHGSQSGERERTYHKTAIIAGPSRRSAVPNALPRSEFCHLRIAKVYDRSPVGDIAALLPRMPNPPDSAVVIMPSTLPTFERRPGQAGGHR